MRHFILNNHYNLLTVADELDFDYNEYVNIGCWTWEDTLVFDQESFWGWFIYLLSFMYFSLILRVVADHTVHQGIGQCPNLVFPAFGWYSYLLCLYILIYLLALSYPIWEGFFQWYYLFFCYRPHNVFDAKEVSDRSIFHHSCICFILSLLHCLCNRYSLIDIT